MFTRFAKGFLWLSLVAVVIAAIAVASFLGNFLWFLIIFVGGFVTLMYFGMFVELCNNILDIKRYLLRGDYTSNNVPSYNNYSVPTSNNTYSSNNSYNSYNSNGYNDNSGSMLSQAAKAADLEKKEEPQGWFCRQCGTKNKMHATFCASCGKTK